MHASRPGGHRDVDAIVDDHARRCALDRGDGRPRQREELAIVEMTFADLNQVHAGVRRLADERDERALARSSIGHEAENRPFEVNPQSPVLWTV